jgi:hypothetical protein
MEVFFSDEWHAFINSFMSRGSVAIKANDDVGQYFQIMKGLRHGNPLVADMLAIMIEHAKIDGLIEGVIPHLLDGGFLSLDMLTIQFYLWNMTLRKQEIRNLFF